MKKALVIGSEGNIGKPLVAHLIEKGYEVTCCDIKPGYRPNYYVVDITKPVDLVKVFDFKPDYIFLLAAMVSRVTCEQSAGMAIDTNVVGTQNVIEFAKHCGAKLINFSTSEVYGPDNREMDETYLPKPNNRYGLSKFLAEQLVEYEVEQHGLRAVTLRPFMIYDENEDLGDHRSAMMRFAYNLATGQEIEVHQGSTRGWLHISDAVRAVEAAARVEEYTVINIGNPDIRSIHELAEMIRERLGADKELIKINDLPNRMTLVKCPRLERQRDILGLEDLCSLEDGVDRVCKKIIKRIQNTELERD